MATPDDALADFRRRRRRLRRFEGRARVLPWLIVVVPVLILLGILAIAGPSRNMLETGECLSTLEKDDWDGYLVVDCADPAAAYTIVNKVTGKGDLDACADYPDGETRGGGLGKKTGERWEVCAVPLRR